MDPALLPTVKTTNCSGHHSAISNHSSDRWIGNDSGDVSDHVRYANSTKNLDLVMVFGLISSDGKKMSASGM